MAKVKPQPRTIEWKPSIILSLGERKEADIRIEVDSDTMTLSLFFTGFLDKHCVTNIDPCGRYHAAAREIAKEIEDCLLRNNPPGYRPSPVKIADVGHLASLIKSLVEATPEPNE